MKKIYLAGGCFWGVEEYFSCINGVTDTTVGYANSDTIDPTYEQICEKKVKAIETVLVQFNENIVSLDFILDKFFAIIDPISVDKQGGDVGYQYRTGIYYDKSELQPTINTIQKKIEYLQNKYDEPIATEVKPLENFFNAEEYHQDYLKKNPNGYCHIKLD